jgi:hypothetical protein
MLDQNFFYSKSLDFGSLSFFLLPATDHPPSASWRTAPLLTQEGKLCHNTIAFTPHASRLTPCSLPHALRPELYSIQLIKYIQHYLVHIFAVVD